MNILLVYPQMPDTFYSMRHFVHVVGKKAVYPPLGLLTVAALLPADWHKKLMDLNAEPLLDKDLRWADYVFISAMNVQEESVREIILRCKQVGVKTVAGGPLFTHEYIRFGNIDYFVLNEAEITLPLFLEDLKQNKLQPVYRTPNFPDITQSPPPDFRLVNMDRYIYSIIQFSRGCPFKCDFCDVTALFGKRPRTKTSHQIIHELDAIMEQGDVRYVLFADDNLIGNKSLLKKEVLPVLIDWRKKKKPGFFFATQLTINLVDDDELMKMLIDAGFRQIFIGLETPDVNSLKGSLKIQNLNRDPFANIIKLHQTGFCIAGGFIVGFDTDTSSIFQRQIDFIQQSGIPLPIVNILKAPPGTVLYERMKKEGRLFKDFAFYEGDTNIIPVMDKKMLNEGFIELISNIYLPEKSFHRLVQFFRTYQSPKTRVKVPASIQYGDFCLIIRALYMVGIKYKDRKYFWKLILWSLFHKRKNLDLAFFYGVMIHQMHQTYLHIKQRMILQDEKYN